MKTLRPQPFVLNLHDKHLDEMRELREEELGVVAGGDEGCPPDRPIPTTKVPPDPREPPVICDEDSGTSAYFGGS